MWPFETCAPPIAVRRAATRDPTTGRLKADVRERFYAANVGHRGFLDFSLRRFEEEFLSVSADRSLIDNVLKRGASAYIVKSVNPVDLPSVIRQALEETVYTAVGLPDDPSSRAAKAAGLTERELAILTALARGMSNAAIAKQLWVAQQTVKFHLTNIYRKLGVANRTEAARYAYQQGLIESPLHEDEEVPLD